jgi:type IV secretory pathway VirB6-like protein
MKSIKINNEIFYYKIKRISGHHKSFYDAYFFNTPNLKSNFFNYPKYSNSIFKVELVDVIYGEIINTPYNITKIKKAYQKYTKTGEFSIIKELNF